MPKVSLDSGTTSNFEIVGATASVLIPVIVITISCVDPSVATKV